MLEAAAASSRPREHANELPQRRDLVQQRVLRQVRHAPARLTAFRLRLRLLLLLRLELRLLRLLRLLLSRPLAQQMPLREIPQRHQPLVQPALRLLPRHHRLPNLDRHRPMPVLLRKAAPKPSFRPKLSSRRAPAGRSIGQNDRPVLLVEGRFECVEGDIACALLRDRLRDRRRQRHACASTRAESHQTAQGPHANPESGAHRPAAWPAVPRSAARPPPRPAALPAPPGAAGRPAARRPARTPPQGCP
eukprot:COSAG04_NODE_3371_length_2880_cov_7.944984_1_plen_248_part_00